MWTSKIEYHKKYYRRYEKSVGYICDTELLVQSGHVLLDDGPKTKNIRFSLDLSDKNLKN